MPLSEEDARRIRPYVSALDGNVFALAGLPEEVIAVLFAYYSRSKDDLRTNLARLIADQDLGVEAEGPAAQFKLASEKAKAFHEKWVVGYGHSSVAEHAVVHLAIENVSIVTSKLIEDLRLASYTEKSTRYVLWDEDSFHPLPELGDKAALYATTCKKLFRTYLELVPEVEVEVRRRHARGESQTEAAYNTQVRAKTFDLLRGLLPAGTKTDLGLTANARAIEMLLSKMMASPLAEARDVATAMHRHSATVAPTLVKHVTPNEYRRSLREKVPWLANAAGIHGTDEGEDTETYGQKVRLLRWDTDALQRVAQALAYDGADPLWNAGGLMASIGHTTGPKLEAFVRGALEARGKFDSPPRAFETANFAFEVTMDFGAYRDMQRHRMLSPFPQRLTCRLGAEVPEDLDDMKLGERFRDALEQAESAWTQIHETNPWEAQYVVPLAFRLRSLWQMNLRELFHVVELRSARQGHPNYRKVAQQIYKTTVAALPWLRDLIRVDLNEYELTRNS